VLSRGNERKDIFRDDRDRLMFLDAIGEMADNYDVDIFAYVLMGNHYHILLRTNQANLSKSMQWLALTYTRRFNNRHFRSGHLFQGRFKSIIVQNFGLENMHTDQRRNRALVWNDLFGDKPYFKFHANQNAKRF